MKQFLFAVLMLSCFTGIGQSYFQQKVDTKIEVRLDDKKHFLHGYESFQYTNHSPDTLRFIYIHLWPNAYTSDRTRFAEQQVLNKTTAFYFSKAKDRGFIDSLDFHVDGIPVSPISANGLPDITRIDLPKPLPPEASMEVQTPFRVKIPKVFSRLGHTGQAYYISQWFPKPAVYDQKGWHPLPYLDQGEFFSEIGAYDVTVTLPKNYVVMGTGNCTDEIENAWLDSICHLPELKIQRPSKHVSIWKDSINRFPKSSSEWKTLHFHEDNIHDFAWFADKRFVVRKDTVNVAAGAGISSHLVTIYSCALPSDAANWQMAGDYIKRTISYLSDHVGAYPFNTVKVVEGDLKAGGGMEYPTVAVIAETSDENTTRQAIIHEVGHNWFYGILASNERDHAWMDEGINTFYEQQITRSFIDSNSNKRSISLRLEDEAYYNAASTHTDQSISNTSSQFTKINYSLDAYFKTALMLNWLQSYMGKDTFQAAMKDYYSTLKFHHPYPNDMEGVFQRNISRPVNWFFDGALSSNKGVDFALKSARVKDGNTVLYLRNKSNFAAPIRINAFQNGAITDSIWSLPFAKDTALKLSNTSATFWKESAEIPDYYAVNNHYNHSGLFHRKAFRVKAGLGIGRKEAVQLFALPAPGYNLYDGFMGGILLHNLAMPQNRFRFAIAPMYSFRAKSLVGGGSIGYWFYPKQTFQEIVAQLDLKSFHYDSTSLNISSVLRARYFKIAPSVSFVFKNASPLSTVTRTIMLKGYVIFEDDFAFKLDPSDSLYKPSLISGFREGEKKYGLLRYTHINARTFNPFSYTLETQLGKTFSKINAEGKLRIDYNTKGKGLLLRGFAGKYIKLGKGTQDDSRYWLTTSYTAANDYLYDGTYFGRSAREGFASRQVSIQEGGGKLSTPFYGFPLGISDDWLVGINIKSDIPLRKIPVRLYLDACTYADAKKVSPSGNRFLYTGGIELHALQDILLVHIPLVMSTDYNDYLKSIFPGKRFANSISFAIQLQNINWLRTVSSGVKYLLN